MKENNFKEGNNNNKNIYDYKLWNDLTKDSFAELLVDKAFIVFNSINEITYLIYSTKKKSIISYDLINEEKINEIKNAHANYITFFNHFFDKNQKKDFILSASCSDNNIKIWDIHNYECILNLSDIYNTGEITSACFLTYENNNYILSGDYSIHRQPIKVFDFKGNLIKTIDELKEKTLYIDTFYNKQSYKMYILTGHNGFIASFDYKENIIKHIYSEDDNKKLGHFKVIVWPLEFNNKEERYKLIESCDDGYIRIWNFDEGTLLKKFKVKNKCYLYGICLLNDDYSFVGCSDKTIKIIDLYDGKIVKELTEGCQDDILCISFINHPKYEKCLISQGIDQEQIKIWVNKKFLP